eukprot:COSAG02_NODE_8717_length_2461_cov_2.060914_2_plen_48_part_00
MRIDFVGEVESREDLTPPALFRAVLHPISKCWLHPRASTHMASRNVT